jgi:hypothetical protein
MKKGKPNISEEDTKIFKKSGERRIQRPENPSLWQK